MDFIMVEIRLRGRDVKPGAGASFPRGVVAVYTLYIPYMLHETKATPRGFTIACAAA